MDQRPTVFLRGNDFRRTYDEKVLPHESVRKKLRQFMHAKRENPQQSWGGSDTHFVARGPLAGFRHAHLTQDLSIVYRVVNKTVFLYGFYTHNDLGTGNPAKIALQKANAERFQNTTFG